MHFHNWQNPISLIGPMVPKWMSRVTKQRVPINLISHKLIPIYQTRSPLNCWRWRGGPVSASSDIGTGPARQQESGPTIFKLNSTVDTQQCSRRLAASAESGPADRDSSTATSKINAIREWWLLGFFRHLAHVFQFWSPVSINRCVSRVVGGASKGRGLASSDRASQDRSPLGK